MPQVKQIVNNDVSKSPVSLLDNLVQGLGDFIPLTLRGISGQTQNLFQIQNSSGTNLVKVSSSGAVTIQIDSVGQNTLGHALMIKNTTAATSGTQQYSPHIHFIGQGWDTTNLVSKQAEWIIEETVVAGAGGPVGYLSFSSQINSAGNPVDFSFGSDHTFNQYNSAGQLLYSIAAGTNQISWTVQTLTISSLSFNPGYGFYINTQFTTPASMFFFDTGGASGAIGLKCNYPVRGYDASGSDTAGTALNLYGGAPTGSGVGGDINLKVLCTPGTSGSALNTTLSTILTVSGTTGGITITSPKSTTHPIQLQGAASQSVSNLRSILGTSQSGNHLSCYNSDNSTLTFSITSAGIIGVGTWQATKVGLAYGGTNADLSATGGTSQVLKQVSAGAAITVGQLSYSDISGTPTIPTGANPSASIGLSAVNGSATTFLRSDGAPALAQNITPIWIGLHTFNNAIVLTTSATTIQPLTITGITSQSVSSIKSVLGSSQTGDHLTCYNSDGTTVKANIASDGGIYSKTGVVVPTGTGANCGFGFPAPSGGGGGRFFWYNPFNSDQGTFAWAQADGTGLGSPGSSHYGAHLKLSYGITTLTLGGGTISGQNTYTQFASACSGTIIGTCGSGTDKAGWPLYLCGGLPTGSGTPGLVSLQGAILGQATGTALRTTIVDRMIPGCTKLLTNNNAIAIVNATEASGSMIGGIIQYTVEVTDGTDFQAYTGIYAFSGTNKAGTIANTITLQGTEVQSRSGGTLTVTFAISNANPAVISVNANSSLTPSTGYPRITYNIKNFGQQAIAIQ